MMKKLLLATALCTISFGASAQQPKPWFGYNPSRQVCVPVGTPGQLAEVYRENYRTEVEFDDTTDDKGVVTATHLQWLGYHGEAMEAFMFRRFTDCEVYARTRRTDTSRYN